MPRPRTENFIAGCAAFLLLLVIGAILFPVFTAQRGGGPWSCQSNEKLIGLALLQYAQDYDNVLPCGLGQKGPGWAGQIQIYCRGMRYLHCPVDPFRASRPNYPISYAYNLNIVRRHGKAPGGTLSPHTVLVFEITGDTAQVDKPDEGASSGATHFSAVGDGTDGSLRAGAAEVKYSTGYLGKRPAAGATFTQFDAPTGRHNDGANYLLSDGHVRYFLSAQVSSGSDAKGPKDGQTGGIIGRAAGTKNKAFEATFSAR